MASLHFEMFLSGPRARSFTALHAMHKTAERPGCFSLVKMYTSHLWYW